MLRGDVNESQQILLQCSLVVSTTHEVYKRSQQSALALQTGLHKCMPCLVGLVTVKPVLLVTSTGGSRGSTGGQESACYPAAYDSLGSVHAQGPFHAAPALRPTACAPLSGSRSACWAVCMMHTGNCIFMPSPHMRLVMCGATIISLVMSQWQALHDGRAHVAASLNGSTVEALAELSWRSVSHTVDGGVGLSCNWIVC